MTVVWVQPSVPPAFSAIPNVTLVVFEATVFPPESSTVTTGWVVHGNVLAPPPGWVVKATWVALPTVMENAVLVPLPRPGELAVSVYVEPALPTISHPANVATPVFAATGFVV